MPRCDLHTRLCHAELCSDERHQRLVRRTIHRRRSEADAEAPIVHARDLRPARARLHVNLDRHGLTHNFNTDTLTSVRILKPSFS